MNVVIVLIFIYLIQVAICSLYHLIKNNNVPDTFSEFLKMIWLPNIIRGDYV